MPLYDETKPYNDQGECAKVETDSEKFAGTSWWTDLRRSAVGQRSCAVIRGGSREDPKFLDHPACTSFSSNTGNVLTLLPMRIITD